METCLRKDKWTIQMTARFVFVEPSTPEKSFYFRLIISLSLVRLKIGSFCDSAQLLRSQQKPFKLSKYLNQR